jgi:hypothetical protein
LQVSVCVQALLSSQEAVLLVFTQPVPSSQLSSVQTSMSLQSGGELPTQVPAEQVSLVVQALLSLQLAVLFACLQPVPSSQLSSVQTLPSSHTGGSPPSQAPATQLSLFVQALLSVQASPSVPI